MSKQLRAEVVPTPEMQEHSPPFQPSVDFFSRALKVTESGYDNVDAFPTRETGSLKPTRASILDNLFALVSIGTFIADIGMDVVVARQYYITQHWWWFGLTVTFAAVPAIVLQLFSYRWYLEDNTKLSIGSGFLHFIFLAPVERYLNAFYYGCKTYFSKELKDSDYERYLTEWRDITMLRLFEAFLEAGPQVVLQLYILTRLNVFIPERDWYTALAAITSIISIAWAIVSYSHALRMCCNAKGLSWLGFIFQMWYLLFMISSRITALVLFASVFKEWIFVAVSLHFLLMYMLLSTQRSMFCDEKNSCCPKCLEINFNVVVAIIYIFCFLNIHPDATRYRVTLYYLLFLIENVTLTLLWFPNRTIHGSLMYAALTIIFGGFVLGLICMLFYYKFFHPNEDITKGWLQWQYCCCPVEENQDDARTENTIAGRTKPENAFEPGEVADRPENVEATKSRMFSSKPRALKFNRGLSLRATSPGTPIDVELPKRFSQLSSMSVGSPSTALETTLNSLEQKSGNSFEDEHAHKISDNFGKWQVNLVDCDIPSLPSSHAQSTFEDASFSPLNRSEPGQSSSPYPNTSDTTCSESIYPFSGSSVPFENLVVGQDFVTYRPRPSTDSSTSDGDESRPLMKSLTPSIRRYTTPSFSTSKSKQPPETYAQVPISGSYDMNQRINLESLEWEANKKFPCKDDNSNHRENLNGSIDLQIPHSPRIPANHKHSSEDEIYRENYFPQVFGSVELDNDLKTGKNSRQKKTSSLTKSKSLPDKETMRHTVVDWMVSKLESERAENAATRPYRDIGAYTVTVNVNGDKYYTSLV